MITPIPRNLDTISTAENHVQLWKQEDSVAPDNHKIVHVFIIKLQDTDSYYRRHYIRISILTISNI